MSADAPERIWIAPCHRCQGPDDYYLLHPDFRKGKGTEYLRADLATPTPAQAARVLLAKWRDGTFEDAADAVADDAITDQWAHVDRTYPDAAPIIEAWLRAIAGEGEE